MSIKNSKKIRIIKDTLYLLVITLLIAAAGTGIYTNFQKSKQSEEVVHPLPTEPAPTPTPTSTPTPEPTATPTPVVEETKEMLVLIHTAYLLDTPSPKGEALAHLDVDEEVELLDDSDENYLYVLYKGQEGYINKKYLSTKVDEPVELVEPIQIQEAPQEEPQQTSYNYNGNVLTASKGVVHGPSGKETYYNLNMSGVVANAKSAGIEGEYWVRQDGVKMLGNYILAACDVTGAVHNRYDLVETSLGVAICADTGGFAANPTQIDIATAW